MENDYIIEMLNINGVENGMIPRKKTDKKGKKNKVNGVSGFGNLMSRKEAESRNCSAIFICCRRYLPNIPQVHSGAV